MGGLPGWAKKTQARLFRSSISLDIVAGYAGADQIFPGVTSPVDSGRYMVHGHSSLHLSAVLTAVPVTFDDVFAGKKNPLVRDMNVETQPDYAWNRQRNGNSPNQNMDSDVTNRPPVAKPLDPNLSER